MKSYNHLMEKYISEYNFYVAALFAAKRKNRKRKNKKKHDKFQQIKNNPQKYVKHYLYEAEHFSNSAHFPKYIYDGVRRKQRMIMVPTVREQIIHHMIVNVIKPIFMKGMYEHSYGSIPGRGGHSTNFAVRGGKEQIEKWIRRKDKNMKYCLKMDIKKYFDSIPHDILKQKLAKIIHDKQFLRVLYEVIDVTGTDRGIPIGFYTSQWFANWYLTELDHYIKEVLHAKYYIRYMDDMVIFGPNKRELHSMRRAIEEYLNQRLGLCLKENWQVFLFDWVRPNGEHIGRDLDFMGFRFFRDRTILRRSIMLTATRKAKRISQKSKPTIYDCRQMLSYLGWLDCTDTYNMYLRYIKPYVNFGEMKRRVASFQRKAMKEGRTNVV